MLKEQAVEIYSILITKGNSCFFSLFLQKNRSSFCPDGEMVGCVLGQLGVYIRTPSLAKNIVFPGLMIELSSTMSEDVTYATLTFQDYVAAGNNQDRNNLRKRGKGSEMARHDLGGWTGVRYPEVLALTPMLFERSAVEFPKWRQSWRSFW